MHHKSKLPAHFLALLVWGVAVLNVWSAVLPAMPSRIRVIREYLPLHMSHGSRLLIVVAGFLLLFLGYGLWRQKRRAWLATVMILSVSVGLHIAKGLDWEEAGTTIAVLAVLLVLEDRFRARSDPPSTRRGIQVLVISLLFTCLYGTAGFFVLDREFHAHFSLRDSLFETLKLFFTFGQAPLPRTGHAQWFLDSVYLVGALTLVYGVAAALQPVVYRSLKWEEEYRRAAEIVSRHGRSSLARLTILPDKTFFFPPGLDSYLAFRVVGRVAVVLGDPIAAPVDIYGSIAAFADYCEEMDWTPCYYQVLPDYLEDYRRAGYHAICIGQEAIVNLQEFTLEGKAGRTLRNPVNHLIKLGHYAKIHEPPISKDLLNELRAVSDEWLTMMHGREKRFSLGWFDEDYIGGCPVMCIHTPEGRIEAFANIISEYQAAECTIDLMRRRADAEPGTMDFLFVSLFKWARENGFATFNMGLSPLAGVGEKAADPAIERAAHYVYEHINQFYSFKGLHDFKAKFRPIWSPRYLIYAGPASLPGAMLAVIRADAGDNLLLTYMRDRFKHRSARSRARSPIAD